MPPESPDIEAFARAAAAAAGLVIEDAWWPGVVAHVEIMLSRAATLESTATATATPTATATATPKATGRELPEDGAGVFQP